MRVMNKPKETWEELLLIQFSGDFWSKLGLLKPFDSCSLKIQGRERYDDRYSGHKALWMRVIVRAAFDLASYKNDNRLALRKYADDAQKWLFDKSYLFNSFENVCALLGLNPEKVRNWASNLTKEDVMKMEHLDRRPLYDDYESEKETVFFDEDF